MGETQLETACEFVDELLSLGALEEDDPLDPVLANAPKFVLPKPGQPGQWRILADLKSGGQNTVVGADPTVFPKSAHILSQMYTGGMSAVIDASKFFYQFEVRQRDQKYLGCVHPKTLKHLCYASLPLGASQSPALAGRYGSSFLRLLRKKSKNFQGTPRQNMWLNALTEINEYDGAVGHGIVLDAEDGLPAVLVWAHCDDFLIHGPTEAKTTAATIEFLDLAVDVGMLCHPGKLTPPAHIVKYTGFLFDTTTEPSLRIPVSKREKSLALLDFVVRHREKVSRLGLAIVTGILEILSKATPSHIGRAYLRKLYKVIHPEGWEEDDLAFFLWPNLADDFLEDLLWWRHALINDSRHCCRLHKTGTL
jgi:hypothetical protein